VSGAHLPRGTNHHRWCADGPLSGRAHTVDTTKRGAAESAAPLFSGPTVRLRSACVVGLANAGHCLVEVAHEGVRRQVLHLPFEVAVAGERKALHLETLVVLDVVVQPARDLFGGWLVGV